MKPYRDLTAQERTELLARLRQEFDVLKTKNLKLNMARGKPGKEQLKLVSGVMDAMTQEDDYMSDGIDVRNYGELSGLPCAKRLWADILGCREDEVFVGGNASLNLMYDVICKAYVYGLNHSVRPWCKEEKVKFLCPVPGYDRHFTITESFGFEMINIPMLPTGPDMDLVEELVKDPQVKGIWCVPKYSNPQGYIYSHKTVRRLASLRPAAPDFLLIWDNAYCVHEFEGEYVNVADIMTLCRQCGNPDLVYEFASTSKVTMPGSGISCIATSHDNQVYLQKLLGIQTISFDKVNQLRHVKFLKDKKHTLEIMKQHAQILGPKFRMVIDTLHKELDGLDIATWTEPKGGYFVSLDAMPGTAKRTWQLCKEVGVVMTTAGATFPYGKDPQDSNIRIAPTVPSPQELEQAMEVFCTCLKIAALEKLDA